MTEADKYEVLEKIGHGSFGVIRRVRRKVDGMVLCRKEISYLKMSQKEREQLHAEFQILSGLRHPNIVAYYHREHLKLSQDLHLYMEYCGNGDLGRVIRDLATKNQYAEESFVWSIFSQLVMALYRCHYGVDPPEVGKHVLGLGANVKPKAPTGGMTILHRDLKPENVFLNDDNSVKLGDFGLSKIMSSHDFASTYVGTPFYMSPEICAAERYTLKSDIWSLGCIIYELCTREPPFNAKSHFQLVQKIKEGKIAPLPQVYSSELSAVIKDCLRVNPDRRPDTAQLLNMPVVRLMRKEREVVDMSRMLKIKEETANKKMAEVERRLASAESDKAFMRQEIESTVRREWEVKARLEIDRLVNEEMESLRERFEAEVAARVQEEIQKKTVSFGVVETQEFTSSLSKSDYPQSIGGHSTDADGDFPSTTDLTELSIDSPEQIQPLKKSARTPFGRAQTMFAGVLGTPMDIEMASPSPMPLAALSLSPRRNAATKAPTSNPDIFAGRNEERFREPEPLLSESEDDDDEPLVPSPTRNVRSSKNPFGTRRPALTTTKTAPMGHVRTNTITSLNKPIPSLPPVSQLQHKPSNGALRERNNSPNRRLSKIPSAANLMAASGENGLQRKNSTKDSDSSVSKLSNKNVRGRTLVELQQARAGGRQAENSNVSPKRTFKDRAADRYAEPVAVWDPEKDEMPSPFLETSSPRAAPFPFTKLPPELRKKTLRNAVYNSRGVAIGFKPSAEDGKYGAYRRGGYLNLFLTSSQMNREASQLFFEVNTFHLNGYGGSEIIEFLQLERYRWPRLRIRDLVVDLPIVPDLLGRQFIIYYHRIMDMIGHGTLKRLHFRFQKTGIDLSLDKHVQCPKEWSLTKSTPDIPDVGKLRLFDRVPEMYTMFLQRYRQEHNPSIEFLVYDDVDALPFQKFLELLQTTEQRSLHVRVSIPWHHQRLWCVFHKRPRGCGMAIRPWVQKIWDESEAFKREEVNIPRFVRVLKDVKAVETGPWRAGMGMLDDERE
ncbi:uncharacterized protein JN550_001613 [Neoarthrinium moseri]|uniref:uncharacterized protein n=1 Tax=Neoarthrinium moseri TaxID=1658444 RepID=UPI001FDBA62E|nr:uncharacterized protein JN550_001613 [Neoarthrinium moseri]KAI1876117.1 hypothetical protein JN550_001613 [Neoarthrinium moseri]